jgi:LmbE family N-acetylglucosaminyl deacetylase
MGSLPGGSPVLTVCAHPDDESFGLGAALAAFAGRGTPTAVLCLTHGAASSLGTSRGDLHQIRAAELAAAVRELGVGVAAARAAGNQEYSAGWTRTAKPRAGGPGHDLARLRQSRPGTAL